MDTFEYCSRKWDACLPLATADWEVGRAHGLQIVPSVDMQTPNHARRQTDRQTDTDRHRQTQTDTDRDRQTQTDTYRHIQTQTRQEGDATKSCRVEIPSDVNVRQ